MMAGDGDDSGKRGLLRLKVSNTLLKSSSSPPSPKSDSINFGGVAVLAELAVIARSLALPEGRSSKEGVEGLIGFLFPKEKVRPTARREKAEWGGGMGISWRSGASVEEGRVDDELKRAEEELSYGFPEKVELSVPPLPLSPVSLKGRGGEGESKSIPVLRKRFLDPGKDVVHVLGRRAR